MPFGGPPALTSQELGFANGGDTEADIESIRKMLFGLIRHQGNA